MQEAECCGTSLLPQRWSGTDKRIPSAWVAASLTGSGSSRFNEKPCLLERVRNYRGRYRHRSLDTMCRHADAHTLMCVYIICIHTNENKEPFRSAVETSQCNGFLCQTQDCPLSNWVAPSNVELSSYIMKMGFDSSKTLHVIFCPFKAVI